MLPYLVLTAPIALMAVVAPIRRRFPILWGLMFVALVIFVGLRHHVGMDWNNYLVMIARANAGDFWQSLLVAEPSYALLLWISGQNGWGIYGAYFVGALIFMAGLFRYARVTPAPWIALLVAMPYLVIVISMSAARQSIAVGILLWIAAEWSRASFSKRIAFILVASSFHLSAIGFLVFALVGLRIQFWIKFVGSAVLVALTIYTLQLSGRVDTINELYLTGQTDATRSSGALFHVMLNGGPALVGLLIGRRSRYMLIPDAFHMQMALLAVALIPAALIYSTAASRITIYLFPVSIWFFSAIPFAMKGTTSRFIVKAIVAIFFVGMTAFWLSAGNSAIAYKNYNNLLLIPPHDLTLCCE